MHPFLANTIDDFYRMLDMQDDQNIPRLVMARTILRDFFGNITGRGTPEEYIAFRGKLHRVAWMNSGQPLSPEQLELCDGETQATDRAIAGDAPTTQDELRQSNSCDARGG